MLVSLVAVSALAADPESQPVAGPWRVELAVSPVSAQVNGLMVQHVGTSVQLAVVVAPHLRLVIAGTWNWFGAESALHKALIENVRLEGQVASELLADVLVAAGPESVLSRGRIDVFPFPHRLEFSVSGFIGAASSRALLKPVTARQDGSLSPATFGDTGWRPVFGAAAGVRFEFFERFSLRVDLREAFFTTRVQTVNGCNVDDLRAMDDALRGARPVTSATLTAGCRVETFDGVDAQTGLRRGNFVPLALGLVRNPNALWTSLQALQVSLGVVF